MVPIFILSAQILMVNLILLIRKMNLDPQASSFKEESGWGHNAFDFQVRRELVMNPDGNNAFDS